MKTKPVRHGVRASEVVFNPTDGATLLDALCARFAHISAAQWTQRFLEGAVLDETAIPLAPDFSIKKAVRIFYFRQVENEACIALQERIIFQDAHIVVADKPHFLPVAPVGEYVKETLLSRLIARTGIAALSPLHRLDKDTAGLVIFSAQPATRGPYQALFRDRALRKVYEAIALDLPFAQFPLVIENRLEENPVHFMQMQVTQGEANAKTTVSKIETIGAHAHYRLLPETGQRHQLRVQMAHLGAPILNDPIYPELRPKSVKNQYDAPLQLLAKSLEFIDPISHQSRYFETGFQLRIT